jgi:hypothetical protein
MRSVAAAALLLLATAASGGELIRFRAPDGRVGMVDHPSKLPPGAVVVERREKTERAPEPAEERRDAPPPAQQDRRSGRGLQARPGDEEETSWRAADSAECLRFGLPTKCSAGKIQIAENWCERGRDARTRIERAEQGLEQAEESLEDCETASLRGGYCSRGRLEQAEVELEDAEAALAQLESDCRDRDCLPGWVRGDCR